MNTPAPNNTLRLKRVSAATLAIAIMGGTIAMNAPAAMAQVNNPGDLVVGTQAIPDPTITSTLTVHKLIGAETTTQANGEVMTDPAGTTRINGIGFTIEEVNVNLTTPEGWEQAKDYASDPVNAPLKSGGYTANATTDRVSGQDGKAVFNNVPMGLYKVTEQISYWTPTDARPGSEQNESVLPGAPFLVYLPMTNAAGDGWNTDVNAYPKGSRQTVHLAVNDRDKQVGDDIIYTATSPVPPTMTTATAPDGKYDFIFTVDAANAYVDAASDIKVVLDENITLVPTTDYTVALGQYSAGPGGGNSDGKQIIRVSLTPEGRAKLVANNGQEVVMTMNATQKLTDNTDGMIDTVVVGEFNDGRSTATVLPTSGDIRSYLGRVQVNLSDGNTDNALTGADFQIYKTDQCDSRDDVQGLTPITTATKDKWTTNDQGNLIIEGIQVSDFANGVAEDMPAYCLVQTKAPQGYVLLDTVYPFEMSQQDVIDSSMDNIAHVVDIENFTSENELPLTGGAGIAALLVFGAGVVGTGVAVSTTRKKKNNA